MKRLQTQDSVAGCPLPPEPRPSTKELTHYQMAELSLDILEAQVKTAEQGIWVRHMAIQKCKGCGAQVEIPKEVAKGDCIFCGRAVKSGEPQKSAQLPDQGLIPFKLGPEEAVENMKSHISSLWFRPSRVKREVSLNSVRRVYVPFWVFDTDIECEWDGKAQEWTEPTWFERNILGSEGSYKFLKPVSGCQMDIIDDWLVCASGGMTREMLEQVEPFTTEGLVKAADREKFHDIPLEYSAMGPREAWEQAKLEIRKAEFRKSMKLAATQGGVVENGVTITGRVQMTEPAGKSVILPIYIFNGGKGGKAQVVMNGETGKVGSKISYSWFKLAPLVMMAAFLFMLATALTGGMTMLFLIAFFIHDHIQGKRKLKRDEMTFLED